MLRFISNAQDVELLEPETTSSGKGRKPHELTTALKNMENGEERFVPLSDLDSETIKREGIEYVVDNLDIAKDFVIAKTKAATNDLKKVGVLVSFTVTRARVEGQLGCVVRRKNIAGKKLAANPPAQYAVNH